MQVLTAPARFAPGNYAVRSSLTSSSQPPAPAGDSVQVSSKEKPSLTKRVLMTSIGMASILGSAGWVVGAVTGNAGLFPLGVCVGLAAGVVIGVAAHAIEKQKSGQQQGN